MDARKGKIDCKYAEQLQSIGVRWGKDFDARWQEGYDSLMKYKEHFGHCNLDLNIVRDTHKKLSYWVGNQLDFLQGGTLLPKQEAMLNSVGFAWHGQCLKEVSDPYNPLSRCSFKTACIASKI